jgi:hypothetical protein
MSNRLPVPEELLHLIEKRDSNEKKSSDRRVVEERRSSDMGPLGAIESSPDLDELPIEDRRSKTGRRVTAERRTSQRTEDNGTESVS